MFPVSWFRSKYRESRFGSSESEGGIEPVKSLKDNSREVKDLILLRKNGTGPERLFQLRRRYLRRVSLVILSGIVPVRFVTLWNCKVSRYGRSPTEAGICPEMLAEKTVRALIRLVWRSQSTTYQSQQSVLGSHEAKWYGLFKSFLIRKRTFLSWGLHFSEKEEEGKDKMRRIVRGMKILIFIV